MGEPGITMLETWNKAMQILRSRLDPIQFDRWLSPIQPEAGTDGRLTLEVPDEFSARWVSDNYLELIKDALWDTARKHVGIDFKVRAGTPPEAPRLVPPAPREPAAPVGGSGVLPAAGAHPAQAAAQPPEALPLVPWYTFGTFVIGPSNQMAHSACELVAGNLGGMYNPLYVYGGVGLGKTHLLHAIGHHVIAARPGTRVLYMSGESYVNEVMTARRNDRLDVLRHRYRGQCDVLLVDDVQYLADREFAQEEFFHTFNELHNAQRQIVISGDQFPSSMPKFSERLRSRFEWGLIVDVAPPDHDLRVRVLRQKAGREGQVLPDDVAEFLAARFSSSCREIEGALNRVTAAALIKRIPISLELARSVTDRIIADRKGRLTPEIFLKTVADYFQVSVADLKSERRNREVSRPRQVAILLVRKHTGASLPAIGDLLGGRSHTTILAAHRQIEETIAAEPGLERAVKDIERQMGL